MAFNFKAKIAEIQKMKRTLPIQVGNIAKNHFLNSFRNQGFTDTNLSPWQKRKTRNSSDRRNPKKRRAILVDTGAMSRSIKVGTARFNRIEIGAYGIDYAQYHNDPKKARVHRPFISDSVTMNRKIKAKIRNAVKDVLRK